MFLDSKSLLIPFYDNVQCIYICDDVFVFVGGTHVKNTCELQMFKLLGGYDKEKGALRIKFMSGKL